MATIGNSVKTLEDHAKSFTDRKVSKVIELLSQENAILEDMPFREGNMTGGHRTTIRTGLPEVFWRNYNQGIPTSKSKKATVDEKTGMLESYSECDVKLAKLEAQPEQYRMQEARAFLQAMGIEAAETYFYGNAGINPEEITGLATRYSSLSAENSENIVDAGGTGSNNSSIWLLCFGEDSLHGIFPRGSQAGIQHYDLGMQTAEFGEELGGRRMQVYRDHFSLDTGIVLKDWRYAVRIANIDIAALQTSTPPDLIDLMIKATHRLYSMNYGKCCFYMNRTVNQFLDIQKRDDVAQAGMTYQEVDGKRNMTFRGIPIKRVDALIETEERVV
jgi:hypothetical protein